MKLTSFALLALLGSLALTRATGDEEKGEKGDPKGGEKGEKPPVGKPPVKGGGKGDPIMTGLDGRSFEFFGTPGSTYNVISEKNHQVSMTLKAGQMWDHEGTYISSLGMTYGSHTVQIEDIGNEMTVTLDGKPLVLRASQTEQEVIMGLAEGELSLVQSAHKADFGKALDITTDLLQFSVWLTPAGTRDEGGKVQPSYLNFDVSILATPANNAMEGIIGETYATASSGAPLAAADNDFKFHGVEADYEMASLFSTSHPKCIFGKSAVTRARKLIEVGTVTFPLKASSRGIRTILRASGRGLVKGRKTL